MFTAIGNAIKALMLSITTFAGALDKISRTVDNLASVAEETSKGYLDETRLDNAAKLQAKQAQLQAQLTNP